MENQNELKSFSLDACKTYVNAVSLDRHLTLRNACVDYRDAGGVCWVGSDMPEASAAVSREQIPCLNRFRNIVGHMNGSDIICFNLQNVESLLLMSKILAKELSTVLHSRRLWALPNTTKYTLTGGDNAKWRSSTGSVKEGDFEILGKVLKSLGAPLSANITHAAMESNHFGNKVGYEKIFLYPHNAATSVGLIGSLHDNECIDMSPGEEPKIPNFNSREYIINEHLGFICAGHTSHSGEAGRIRRVTCNTRIRVLCPDTISDIVDALSCTSDANVNADTECEQWTLFCMGIYCNITLPMLYSLCKYHRSTSLIGPPSFSLHIQENQRLVVMSITSGSLIKQCSNGYWADNIEVHKSSRIPWCIRPLIDTKGEDSKRACMSAFFCLWPYMEQNKAPRPLIASVQTPQAVCLPWCPATAAVTPCYAFNPIITTPMYNRVLEDLEDEDTNISCCMPGENPMCLFLNLMYTYEDAIVVSKRYVDNGGFSTVSLCSYNLSISEYIPPVGSTMCGVLSLWWKSPCQKDCTHNKSSLISGKMYRIGDKPTGVVHSVNTLKTGEINVKVRSFQQLQDGDKLSMPHGQKGIAVIVKHEDMPIAHSPKHGTIVPDVVVGMSSVITRQTNGVLYEAAASLSLLHRGASLPHVVKDRSTPSLDDEFTVTYGSTGEFFKTVTMNESGKYRLQITKATMGMIRVLNQTQMSRERHQVSHVKVGKNTLRTPDGRARGGGVAWGEMEVQASSSAGLQCCDDEITERGDRIVGEWCTECQRLGLLCTCTTEDHRVQVTAAYDLITTDCVNAVVYNGSFQYQLAPES